ncbi:MAG: hypothetical protein V1706_06410 [Pseudomonadota bacterium]
MGCCRKLLLSENGRQRSVICSRFIRPIQLLTVVGVWSDAVYGLLYRDTLTLPVKLFMAIHLVLTVFILIECRRSAIYHRLYGNYDKKH